jgi:hypothetical protein
MNRFRLNLIRDQVPPPAQRRLRFRAMMIYLVIAGLVLVAAVGLASARASRALEHREQSQRLEKTYAESHEGRAGVKSGAVRLQSRLAAQLVALRAVSTQLSSDPRPARFLRALALSLPPNISLYKVSLNGEEKTLAFELRVLGPGGEGEMDASELMGRWQENPAISSEITQLAYLGSRVENTGGGGNKIMQFSGRLEKGRP